MPLSQGAQRAKSIFASKTFWGALTTFAAAVLPTLGIGVTAEDVNNVSTHVVGLIDRAAEFGGILFAIYGRIQASQPVTLFGS